MSIKTAINLPASDRHYDVVIVGSGVIGATYAKVLAESAYRDGKAISILILEAGRYAGLSDASYSTYLDTFHRALIKTPNAPYPDNPNAPAPEDLAHLTPPRERYFRQEGPLPFDSNNTRALGGTTLHWMGIALRMVPADFELATRYDIGVDWPIKYQHLKPYYEKAEWELGVAADAKDQENIQGVESRDFGSYQFPMRKIPVSHLDQVLTKSIGTDFKHTLEGQDYPVRLVSIPQARNSTPESGFKDPRSYLDSSRKSTTYRPYGSPDDPLTGIGQRCEGNSSCIPLCPARAKFSALKTVQQLLDLSDLPGISVDVVAKAVASKVVIGGQGRVSHIVYQKYDNEALPYATEHRVGGRNFILAASAIENAKLLLASRCGRAPNGLANGSGDVGRHLMDHPFVLTWGLMPEGKPVGAFRGPGVTSDLPLRDGAFRKSHSAFRTDVGNWGWGLADAAPGKDLERFINPGAHKCDYTGKPQSKLLPNAPVFGSELRKRLKDTVQRQFMLGFLFEQLPCAANRVTISDDWRDQLGIHKPVIHYDIADYTRAGIAEARRFSSKIYKKVEAVDYTDYEIAIGNPIQIQDQTFKFIGAGHIMGTHRMGSDRTRSVVNRFQRSWEHENLFVVGCGSMPTVGTSNPTLTAVALGIMSAEHLYKDLELANR